MSLDLDRAIELLKVAVKNNGTNDQNHIDLTLVPSEKRDIYEKAMAVSALAIREGKISRDEFLRRLHLNN